MFEDLLPQKIGKIKIKKIIHIDPKKFEASPFCPYCKSKDVKNTGKGVFIPGKRFKAKFRCNFCWKEWDVIFDNYTNVLEVVAR